MWRFNQSHLRTNEANRRSVVSKKRFWNCSLIEKLTTEEELSGLLNLAIIALKQLIKDNGFIYVDDVHSVQKEYNQRATIVDDFLNKKCRLDLTDRNNYAVCRDIFHSYVRHCSCSDKTPVTNNVFGGHLMAKGIKKERKIVNSTREYCYVDISILYDGGWWHYCLGCLGYL